MRLEQSVASRTGWGHFKVPQWGQVRVPFPGAAELGEARCLGHATSVAPSRTHTGKPRKRGVSNPDLATASLSYLGR